VCTFTIAVNSRFASQGGERQTDFFRINAWRQLGDTCARYLQKGRKVAVIGELQARTYEAKDGTTRMSLDVSADEVEFLTPKSADDSGSGYSAPRPSAPAQDLAGFTDINSDDLPF
jgi:single-strand DNA-binding protein